MERQEYSMLFDIPVKEKREDFFNYRMEMKALSEAVKGGERLTVIRGPRRVGKSSIMKVEYNMLDMPKAWMDGRKIFAGVSTEGLFYDTFLTLLEHLRIEERVMSRIKSVSLGGFGAEVRQPRPGKIAEAVDRELKARKKKAVIFIDQAQLLKKDNADRFLAYIYDNLVSIQLVAAGSQVGLLDEFVGKSADAPLFGRAKTVIELKRLGREKATEFLKMGFEQAKADVPEQEIEKAIDVVDGLIGWLNYYGHYRLKHAHGKAVEQLKKDAAEITANEVKRFLEAKKGRRDRYVILLKAIVSGPLGWEELKTAIELKEKSELSDSRLDEYLSNLQAYGFIERQNGHYVLSDPLVREALASGI